jgi:hypothetical protein
MKLWILILAAGLVTFAIRLVFILAYERLPIPDWFQARAALRPRRSAHSNPGPGPFHLERTAKPHMEESAAPGWDSGYARRLAHGNVALTLVVGLAVFFLLYTFAL